jgi:hypothetical protein
MLLEAKAAGEALLQAKQRVPKGNFKAWVAGNTHLSRSQAYRYIAVVERWAEVSCPQDTLSEVTIEAFLGYEKKPSSTPPFTRDDAEYALKIHARTTSGFEGEASVAKAKLEKLAIYRPPFGLISY